MMRPLRQLLYAAAETTFLAVCYFTFLMEARP